MTLGGDGNLYGTTDFGGNTNLNNGSGYGTVFQITTNGTLTTLVSFANTNGANPYAGLTLDNDGNFYGTTPQGGSTGWGTVFQVTTNGTLTTLVSFAKTNGGYPEAALTLGNDGNFYGTTYMGGNTTLDDGNGVGTIFRVTTNGALNELASFNGTNGWNPDAALTLGNDGNFYGTTDSGGSSFAGTVFKVTTNGTLTTLVSFGNTNGAEPDTALVLGSDGNFYGTTDFGGDVTNSAYPAYSSGFGTVFKVTTNGTLTTLAFFSGTNGINPNALTLGNDGNFYGTTRRGGNTNLNNIYGYGTVFCISFPPVVQPTLTLQFWAGYPLLSLYGTLGDTYRVEYTTNLADSNWTPMLIVPSLSISPFRMIDPAGAGQPMRYYRAVMQ